MFKQKEILSKVDGIQKQGLHILYKDIKVTEELKWKSFKTTFGVGGKIEEHRNELNFHI